MRSTKIHCIGILTSGGDSPGMNAAIRAVTRSIACHGVKVKGNGRRSEGLIHGEIKNFTSDDVLDIIQTRGTAQGTAHFVAYSSQRGLAERAAAREQGHSLRRDGTRAVRWA